MEGPVKSLVVREDSDGLRLDLYLSKGVPGLSRTHAKKLIQNGDVTVNGAPAKKSGLLRVGDEIAIWVALDFDWRKPAADRSVPISILYEDDLLLAVSKPAHISSVPLSPTELGTLAGAIAARYPECAPLGKRAGDGGLVQRLDFETSGVVLAARNQTGLDRLTEIQNRGGIEKRYIAAVARSNLPVPSMVNQPLASSGTGGRRVKCSPMGQSARTELMALDVFAKSMRIQAMIAKGLRHQIRVHLAHAGFPILGDALYNPNPKPPWVTRMLLHAGEVRLPHPVTGSPLVITAPLPNEFME